jgi:hypothetical protein
VQHSWATNFSFTEVLTFVTVPGSIVGFESAGGPLLINVDMSLFASVAQTFNCRPMINGVWAGVFGGYPYVDRWTEGLTATQYGWVNWSKSRVYTGIPAGMHTLSIQCLKDGNVSMMVGHPIVPQSVSVLEMHYAAPSIP